MTHIVSNYPINVIVLLIVAWAPHWVPKITGHSKLEWQLIGGMVLCGGAFLVPFGLVALFVWEIFTVGSGGYETIPPDELGTFWTIMIALVVAFMMMVLGAGQVLIRIVTLAAYSGAVYFFYKGFAATGGGISTGEGIGLFLMVLGAWPAHLLGAHLIGLYVSDDTIKYAMGQNMSDRFK